MKKIVTAILNGYEVDFAACVNMMDDEIREELHAEYAGGVTEQEFLDLYIARHAAKYDGAEFQI